MNPSFSHDLIEKILLRLPVKSLLRFKCVCKSWLSLISDPNFAKSHFDLAAAPTYRILHKSDHGSIIRSVDTEASLLSDSSVLNLPIPLPYNGSYVHNFRILGCCQGLVVFDYDAGDLMLWNPSTNFHKHIPYYHVDYMDKVLNGFGYDASTDDYLIIIKAFETNYYEYPDCSMEIWGTRFEFFSFKTNSWNRLEGVNFPDVNTWYRYTLAGSFFNGSLHWLALSSDKKHFDAIIAYDLKQRSLSEIPMPYDLTRALRSELLIELTIMKGCLSLCCNSHKNQMVEIWIMEDYRVESSWTKSIVLSTRDIGGIEFFPMCFTKGGEIIGSTSRGGLAKFNDKGDMLEHQRYDQGQHLRCVLYRESLLSALTTN